MDMDEKEITIIDVCKLIAYDTKMRVTVERDVIWRGMVIIVITIMGLFVAGVYGGLAGFWIGLVYRSALDLTLDSAGSVIGSHFTVEQKKKLYKHMEGYFATIPPADAFDTFKHITRKARVKSRVLYLLDYFFKNEMKCTVYYSFNRNKFPKP
nr:uncharacterized protein LOC111512062 [Leptinotarsa decemlineata]